MWLDVDQRTSAMEDSGQVPHSDQSIRTSGGDFTSHRIGTQSDDVVVFAMGQTNAVRTRIRVMLVAVTEAAVVQRIHPQRVPDTTSAVFGSGH